MNVALHGMEAVVAQGSNGHGKEQPLLVRYADDFVILHPDLGELKQAIKRVKQWLATIGLHLNADKTRITHTLTAYRGQVGFDFLGFNIRQEPKVKTIITPSQEADARHLAAIDQRLRQLHTAPQSQVIAELNPLILGWVSYYNGIVPAATMSRYDDLVEQRLINWASKRHSGKTRDWLLARYWQCTGNQRPIFATPEGIQLRRYQQTSILKR